LRGKRFSGPSKRELPTKCQKYRIDTEGALSTTGIPEAVGVHRKKSKPENLDHRRGLPASGYNQEETMRKRPLLFKKKRAGSTGNNEDFHPFWGVTLLSAQWQESPNTKNRGGGAKWREGKGCPGWSWIKLKNKARGLKEDFPAFSLGKLGEGGDGSKFQGKLLEQSRGEQKKTHREGGSRGLSPTLLLQEGSPVRNSV